MMLRICCALGTDRLANIQRETVKLKATLLNPPQERLPCNNFRSEDGGRGTTFTLEFNQGGGACGPLGPMEAVSSGMLTPSDPACAARLHHQTRPNPP